MIAFPTRNQKYMGVWFERSRPKSSMLIKGDLLPICLLLSTFWQKQADGRFYY
jgi:hypothetical protein